MRHKPLTFGSQALATRFTVGPLLGAGLAILELTERVHVSGLERAIEAARKGNLVIAANHPTGAETFIIPALFCPEYYYDDRLFLWSMPKQGLVHPMFHQFLRCIEMQRSNPRHILEQALPFAVQVLRHSGVILTHPENGRTVNGKEFVERGDRRIRRIKSRVTEMAANAGASILPLWVDVKNVTEDMRFWRSIAHLYRHGPMRLYFGEPYRTDFPFDADHENKRLEYKILTV